MSLDVVIFVVSAVVAVFGATMMIAQRNAVASVLYMILSLVAQAVCYVQLGAMFLGIILVIVYAGAIMVLFLFVIMLLNLRGNEDLGEASHPLSRVTKVGVGVLLTLELAFLVKAAPMHAVATGVIAAPMGSFGSVHTVATLMFTNYLYPFELTGVLLLAAVVGAVVVAKVDRSVGLSEDRTGAEPSEEERS
jgi:NADH-quinone oxidoreductase subunit J